MIHYNIKKIIIMIILYSSLSDIRWIQEFSIGICVYLLFKWITDYRKCTFSYIECKMIRGVKKEEGIFIIF